MLAYPQDQVAIPSIPLCAARILAALAPACEATATPAVLMACPGAICLSVCVYLYMCIQGGAP
jgi:hypothetical protein